MNRLEHHKGDKLKDKKFLREHLEEIKAQLEAEKKKVN